MINLKVIHLIRKIERIDRDMEEIQTLLNTLQMDREYSKKIKDSLIEEYHRLKQLKSMILKQVVHIPPNFENFVEEVLTNNKKENQSIEIESNVKLKPNLTQNIMQDPSYKKNHSTENNSSKLSNEKKSSQQKADEKSLKKSPFIFKFE